MKSKLRIFSYLPNPRVWKALIAAEICGVDVEVVGDKPDGLANWLWDFEACELPAQERTEQSPYARVSRRGFQGTLYKTDAFLSAHPFGTVPAAFSADGKVGIFESNSILRAVARLGDAEQGLYGRTGIEASRIDSFLDAALVFAREAQVYLLAANEMDAPTRERMAGAYTFYLDGIEQALANSQYVAGDELTIADIGYACDLAQFLRERRMSARLAQQGFAPISEAFEERYPRNQAHLRSLIERPEFNPYLGEYVSAPATPD